MKLPSHTPDGDISNNSNKILHSIHAREIHEFFTNVQTLEKVKKTWEILLHGNIILENDGFIVYQLPARKAFYIYSKKIEKFISLQESYRWGKSTIVAFKNIIKDDTGRWIYIEIEPEVWMHLSNEVKALDFEAQRNSNGEKTYLYKAPSDISDEERRLFADTMGSWEHIPIRSRFANIVWALNPYTGDPIMLAITTDIKLQ